MIYNLADDHDKKRFSAYANKMIEGDKFVELKTLNKRSLKQNNYIHLIISAFALETGYSVECVKTNFFKMKCNEEIFVSVIDGSLGKEFVLRSSADLTTAEMTLAIERFRNWAAQQGYYLPEPDEESILKQIAVESSKMKQFL